MKVLVINPGATSTKFSIFDEDKCIFSDKIVYDAEQMTQFHATIEQVGIRLEGIEHSLKSNNMYPPVVDCVVGRGGQLRHIPSGTYLVDENVIKDMETATFGDHASNLGTILADFFAKKIGTNAYFCDPVSTDELQEVARISGFKGIVRESYFHALNQKAAARAAAEKIGKAYEEINLIVVHMGGGVSVAAHSGGKVIDVNNVKDEGAFAMDRAGGVPITPLLKTTEQNRYEIKTIRDMLHKKGGVLSYLGTTDLIEVEKMIDDGNQEAALIFEALAYQLSKDMGAMNSVLKGKCDGIVLTGGMANSSKLVGKIMENAGYIAPLYLFPGEFEMEAMAENAIKAHKSGKYLKY